MIINLSFDPERPSYFVSKEQAEKNAYEKIRLALTKSKSPYNLYAIGTPDGNNDGDWCIHSEQDLWLVYKSERGLRSHLSIFLHGTDAGDYFIWRTVGQA